MKRSKFLVGITMAAVMLMSSLPVHAYDSVEITPDYFPDPTLRKVVELFEKIEGNNDGELASYEAALCQSLDLDYYNLKAIMGEDAAIDPISDLKGLRFFINLTHLNVAHNNISEIPQDEVRGLKVLDCSSNKLTELNVSRLYGLKTLSAYNNPLKTLNLPDQLDVYIGTSAVREKFEDQCTGKECDTYSYGNHSIVVDYGFKLVRLYDVNCEVYPSGAGTIEGTGSFTLGTQVTLNATANKGYTFDHYEINGRAVTKQTSYTLEVEESVSLTAVFTSMGATPQDPDEYEYEWEPPQTDPGSSITGSPSTPSVTPEADPNSSKNGIEGFVDRIYLYILDREPEKEGAAFWSKELYSFNKSGAEVAQSFIFSQEFINRNTSDEQFIRILYSTFFGRAADSNGLKYWRGELTSGRKTRVDVANDFIFSQEWADTCAKYGIRSGSNVESTVNIEPSELTVKFVERMYTTCMKREYDKTGRDYWAEQLSNFRLTGEACGVSFFLSDEFVNYNLPNDEFVKRLYATFMDREPDNDGMQYWLGVLKTQPRTDVVYGFTRSPEFTEKCIEARILPF